MDRVFTVMGVVGLALLFPLGGIQAQSTANVCPGGCDFETIQAAVDAIDVGGTIVVGAGEYAGGVVIGKAGVEVLGDPGAVVVVGAGEWGIRITVAGVRVEGLEFRGPYATSYLDVDWDAEPTQTAGIELRPGGTNAWIVDNVIGNVRTGIQVLNGTTGATITGNLIDNTKGSILLRSDVASLAGNTPGPEGNEWDIVVLLSIWNDAPAEFSLLPNQSDVAAYGSAVMALSANNGGMTVLDRRFGSGNRSHAVVEEGHAPGPGDDFGLGNGLGNPRQPYGSIAHGLTAVVAGGVVDVRAGTYGPVMTSFGGKAGVTIQGAAGAMPVVTGSTTPRRLVDLRADGTIFRGFTVRGLAGDQDHVGISISGRNVTAEGNTIQEVLTGIQTTTQYEVGAVRIADNQISDAIVGLSLQNSGNEVTGNVVEASSAGIGIGRQNHVLTGNVLSGNDFTVPAGVAVSALFDADIDLQGVLNTNTFNHVVMVVDPGGAPAATELSGSVGRRIFTSIQMAIDGASPGHTVRLDPGTYTQSFTVNKALQVTASNPMNRPVITGSGTRATVAASDVRLENLIFDLSGDVSTDGVIVVNRVGTWPFAIGYSNVTLEGVDVLGGRRGLYITADNLTIRNSRFEDQFRDALYLNAVSGTTTIQGNHFAGGSAGRALLFENFSSGDPAVSGTILIQDNVATGKGNFLVYNQWQCSSLTPTGGSFTCNEAAENEAVTLVVTDNRIAPFGTAIDIFDPREFVAFDPARFEKIGSMSVTRNTFHTEGTVAIRVPPELFEDHGVLVDATRNWWATQTGPTHTSNPIGTGPQVSGHVEFDPWYLDEGLTALSSELGAHTVTVQTQPETGDMGEPIPGPPTVVVTNLLGAPVAGVPVSVQLSDEGASFASGTLSVATGSDGVAAFPDLVIGTPGTYTLVFSAAGITNELSSQAFAVSPVVTVPSPPRDLAATPGNQEVLLVWSVPASDGFAPISDYLVEYSSNRGATWTTFEHPPSTGTTITVTGLTNSVRYTFRVAAVNEEGIGGFSDSPPGVVPIAPPVISDEDVKKPGQVTATVNGVEVTVAQELLDETTLAFSGDGFVMSFSSIGEGGGASALSGENPVLTFEQGGALKTGGDGFSPGTSVGFWLFSTPVLLGFVDVDEDGRFEGEVVIPENMEVSSHTLQILGVGVDGNEQTIAIGVEVEPKPSVATPAVTVIRDWAQSNGTGTPPTVAHYHAVGAIGVTAGNLAAVNAEIATRDVSEIDTFGKLLAIIQEVLSPTPNVPPVLTVNAGLQIAAGGTSMIGPIHLQVTDVDTPPTGLVFTVVTPPAHGTLFLNGSALGQGGTFTQAMVDSGVLAYTHHGGTSPSDGFSFTVADGAGGSIGETHFGIVLLFRPDPPANVTATPQVGGGLLVTWEVPKDHGSPILRYRVQLSKNDGEWEDGSAGEASTAPFLLFGELAERASYRFRVAAVNATGQGEFSEASAPTVVPVVDAELEATLEADNLSPALGEIVTITFSITNRGANPAADVVASDGVPRQLPMGAQGEPIRLEWVEVSVSQGEVDAETGAWHVGTIDAFATVTMTIKVRVVEPPEVASTGGHEGNGS